MLCRITLGLQAFDVIVGEIKVYPTNEELDSIVEPLYKFNFIKRQWKVTVSN